MTLHFFSFLNKRNGELRILGCIRFPLRFISGGFADRFYLPGYMEMVAGKQKTNNHPSRQYLCPAVRLKKKRGLDNLSLPYFHVKITVNNLRKSAQLSTGQKQVSACTLLQNPAQRKRGKILKLLTVCKNIKIPPETLKSISRRDFTNSLKYQVQ